MTVSEVHAPKPNLWEPNVKLNYAHICWCSCGDHRQGCSCFRRRRRRRCQDGRRNLQPPNTEWPHTRAMEAARRAIPVRLRPATFPSQPHWLPVRSRRRGCRGWCLNHRLGACSAAVCHVGSCHGSPFQATLHNPIPCDVAVCGRHRLQAHNGKGFRMRVFLCAVWGEQHGRHKCEGWWYRHRHRHPHREC
jgi:hypothetical protein